MDETLVPTTCVQEDTWVPGGTDGAVLPLLPPEAQQALWRLYDALADAEAVLRPLYDLQGEERVPLREPGIAIGHAVLRTIEHQRKQMQAVELRIRHLLDVLHDKRTIAVPGIGSVRINNTPKKRYEGDLLLSRLAARVSDEVVDRESGEVPPLAVICEKVARATAEATGSLTPSFVGWRVGELKKHGIDLKDYEYEERGSNPKVAEVKA
ncbi:MAG: hypothetical protein ACEQSX_00415 [Baekduiaceae bacterium]